MQIRGGVRMSSGWSFSCEPSRQATVKIMLSSDELRMLACALAAEADEARSAGMHHEAERLDWRAAALREAAR